MIAIAPTDLDWFETLREELIPSEVNFWTPTPWNVGRLEQGDRFYFLLKAPYRQIGGYGNKCCITGERSPEVLDAAHIQPYVNRESNHIQNGVPLRVDFRKLFDARLVTIDDNYKVLISDRLSSDVYTAYTGQKIHLPDAPLRPSKQALESHRELVFRI